MSRAPKISVLLPVHNGEAYLRPAIESVLGQTLADFELLVIDDGSTDRTAAVVEAFDDPRIRLLRNPANLRLIATLNRGLDAARGEYVARMDADDICLPGRLQAQAAFLDAQRAVGVVGSAVQLIDADGALDGIMRFPERHGRIRWSLFYQSPLAHPAVMMRKALVAGIGGYNPQALHCEDYELWWRASRLTQLANLPQPLLQLRKHAGNITLRHGAVHDSTAVEICRNALGDLLQMDLPPGLIAALMGRGPRTEEHLSQALDVLFRYFRHCIATGVDGRDEAALRGELVDHVSRWLGEAGAAAEPASMDVVRRNVARACGAASLDASNRQLVRGPAARRAVLRLAKARVCRVTRASAARARHGLHSAYRTLVPRSARDHFTRIYERNVFGSRESRSGGGSTLEQTATIAREIPRLLHELEAATLLDAPCGDFNWMRHVELGVRTYIGVDIVAELVARDQTRYGAEGREFICRDLIRDALPAADVILCRDCLVHLNFRDARGVLQNFKRSGSHYLLTTTFPARTSNTELSGAMVWRTLNLELPPFNLPPPLRVINENCTEAGGHYADKSLALWRLEELSL